MIIERFDRNPGVQYAYMNIFPDQFKTENEKEQKEWIKNTMDYFSTVAYSQYRKHRDSFIKNYDLLKGIIDYEHFFSESPETRTFAENLWKETELPSYVKHYPIINPPINTMVGELTKRPDNQRVRAFDDDSKSEELQYRTNLLEQLTLQLAQQEIYRKLSMQGVDISQIAPDEVEQMTLENVSEYLTDYTSTAERWGNHMLTALKARFTMKEKSEDAFRDLLVTSREFFHIFEDNSKLGFNIEVLNPKNEWHLGTPDVKYTSGASGQADTPYATGTVHVMEISEIIEKFPDLTKEEIDHLRKSSQDFGIVHGRESNLFNNSTGINSIKYDTYDRLVAEERMIAESEMKENKDELKDWLGLSNSTANFGYKYTVVRAYWISKKKIGELTYLDSNGNILTTLVDETYKEGSPNEIEIKWGWVNQWYQGTKIGPDIYHVKPFKLLDYSPIIGVIHEIKNTTSKSLIDLMKPFQVLYNICMNQLYRLLEKEIGVVYKVQLRRIPTPKDGDNQDAIELWEEEARTRGIVFEDDSPENLKAPLSNTTISAAIDLSRTNEIQSRYQIAIGLKNECWELIGINRERLGGVAATQTATGTQAALTQSFSQTEPYFAAHEYVLSQVYQAILDAAQYIESNKPISTISYVTSEGDSAFMRINSQDIKLRDLWVIPTNNPEDQRLFNEIRQLSQTMLQNGATPYEIINIYSTNSIRQMKKVFKNLKEKQDQLLQGQQSLEQQQLQQAQEATQMQIQAELEEKERDRQFQAWQNELDRLNKKEVALLNAYGKNQGATADSNADGIADALQVVSHADERVDSLNEFNLRLQEINAKRSEISQKMDIEREKLKVARENMQNDKEIAKINAKNRNKPAAKK